MQRLWAETFRVWTQYLLIALVALPVAALAMLAMAYGISESVAIITSGLLTVALAFTAWRLVERRAKRKAQTKTHTRTHYVFVFGNRQVTTARLVTLMAAGSITVFGQPQTHNEPSLIVGPLTETFGSSPNVAIRTL